MHLSLPVYYGRQDEEGGGEKCLSNQAVGMKGSKAPIIISLFWVPGCKEYNLIMYALIKLSSGSGGIYSTYHYQIILGSRMGRDKMCL